MRTNLLLVILLSVATVFTACKKDKKSDADSLVGTWESVSHYQKETLNGEVVQEESKTHTDPTEKATIVFKADKTATLKIFNDHVEEWMTANITYRTNGNKLTIVDEDGNDSTELTYQVNGNELTTIEIQDAPEDRWRMEIHTKFKRK